MDKRGIVAIVTVIAILAIVSAVTHVGHSNTKADQGSEIGSDKYVQITDQEGRVVTIPANVTHVAALAGQSYEKLILLNQTDKMAVTIRVSNDFPWAYKVAPQLRNIPMNGNQQNPNVEDLISKKVQVVFCLDFTRDKLNSSNIPVVVTQKNSGNPENVDSFVKYVKQEIALYGEVMGPDAKKTADEWGVYFDRKANYVTSRTANLTDSQRPTVYYAIDAMTNQGKNSYPQFYVEMAGGKYISGDTEGIETITPEQLLVWNPDVIYVGHVNSTDIFANDSKFINLKAVQNNKVYLCPQGVAWWDYGAEGVLLMEYFAKTLHPDLFQDLNMTNEVKDYYSRFYHYNLTDDEANRILQHLPPANT
ncbi:Iron(III) ABC transporter, solute-binding protein [Methanosarcina barkeri str. Wiesmoor]|uniref:Iron(III) ABC transporter, solute-binding protein n=2 Tax=Methanosarcina barkeri TaxID=2208 RepID=A0A0E3QPA7_METBA|nr:ABC transporter substrate-binding protein [Methanosarcina barkeri]AKB51735.1 Iron(III) ABC transporter, solute-binding protein [Methanosarcina barkeri str. Wiesmoor]